MAGFAVLRISTNAAKAGLSADLSQVAHRGMSGDLGVIGRMVSFAWQASEHRAQSAILLIVPSGFRQRACVKHR